ncbi:FolB domain-containing protein [Fusarium falciforme]|uniref:FolB domain-containing protein n=1 Tax=Fusarium falciforme TaxID=195108 RepID=UPI00230190D5|nr:FolB domain-containing protein [Fusarium falciforme]WAO83786.1 FolB domain-containing protein [Fusarium falciforme]
MAGEAPIVSSRRLSNDEGDPVAVVRVRNLQTTIQGPKDAWGRGAKQQPLLVSAEVSLTQPFGTSSADDKVASDTVHYGLLSKAILSTLGRLPKSALSLSDVLNELWIDLTGFRYNGLRGPSTSESKSFLDIAFIRRLTISLVLPKASLMGSAIRLSGSALFSNSSLTSRSLELGLEGLRVPTLIGVNSNERTAKQVVIANVRIDEYETMYDDYAVLESVVVDAMIASSYETLEALAADLSVHIAKQLRSKREEFYGAIIRIGLEKPTAVPLADAACVELTVKTEDVKIDETQTEVKTE